MREIEKKRQKNEKDTSVIIFITGGSDVVVWREFKQNKKKKKIKHILNSCWHSAHVQSPA